MEKVIKVKYRIVPKDVKEYFIHKHPDGSYNFVINNEYLGFILDDVYARHIIAQLSDEFEDCPFTIVLMKDK
jgi:hypothetical protein